MYSINFRHGMFERWDLSIGRSATGSYVMLVETWTPRRPDLHQLTGGFTVPADAASWTAVDWAYNDGGPALASRALTALLAEVPALLARPGFAVSDHNREHWARICAAGVESAAWWRERYPNGRPVFEVVGSMSVPRNPAPHNENGTTDDFYG